MTIKVTTFTVEFTMPLFYSLKPPIHYMTWQVHMEGLRVILLYRHLNVCAVQSVFMCYVTLNWHPVGITFARRALPRLTRKVKFVQFAGKHTAFSKTTRFHVKWESLKLGVPIRSLDVSGLANLEATSMSTPTNANLWTFPVCTVSRVCHEGWWWSTRIFSAPSASTTVTTAEIMPAHT